MFPSLGKRMFLFSTHPASHNLASSYKQKGPESISISGPNLSSVPKNLQQRKSGPCAPNQHPPVACDWSVTSICFLGHGLNTDDLALAELDRNRARASACLHKIGQRYEQFFGNVQLGPVGRYGNIRSFRSRSRSVFLPGTLGCK